MDLIERLWRLYGSLEHVEPESAAAVREAIERLAGKLMGADGPSGADGLTWDIDL